MPSSRGSSQPRDPTEVSTFQADSLPSKPPGNIENIPLEEIMAPVFLGFPWWLSGKESAYNAGNLGLIPELGRSPGEGIVYPPQYSGLKNSMDRIVHGVAKSQT